MARDGEGAFDGVSRQGLGKAGSHEPGSLEITTVVGILIFIYRMGTFGPWRGDAIALPKDDVFKEVIRNSDKITVAWNTVGEGLPDAR